MWNGANDIEVRKNCWAGRFAGWRRLFRLSANLCQLRARFRLRINPNYYYGVDAMGRCNNNAIFNGIDSWHRNSGIAIEKYEASVEDYFPTLKETRCKAVKKGG